MRREVIADLKAERQARIHAILSNGGYLQTKEGLDARKNEIEALNDHFNQAIELVMDPGREEREERAMRENPLFAAGIQGLERLKWDLRADQQMAAQLRERGL